MAEVNDESLRRLQNGHQAPQNIDNARTRERSSSEGSSDSEDGERPVRDKLKKTSIAGLSSKAKAGTDKGLHPRQDFASSEPAHASTLNRAPSFSRGRPARKRSFDDLQNDDSTATSQAEADDPPPAKDGHHKRMRSRDISSGEHVSLPGRSDNGVATPLEEESDMDAQKSPGGPGVLVDATIDETVTPPSENSKDPESMTSPKKKRSRDQLDKEDASTVDASLPEIQSSSQKESEPDKKRYREEEQAAARIANEPTKPMAPSTGFANASTASPFGSFASPKKSTLSPEVKPAEPSAFKSSGLSAFASSENSPFGAVGSTSTPSGFGGTTSSGAFGPATTISGFGGASTTSAFGNAGTVSPFGGSSVAAFGSLGGLPSTGGFASSSMFGGGLAEGLGGGLGGPSAQLFEARSAFGDPKGSMTTFAGPSTTKQKAFGAPEADDDSGSGDDSDSQNDEEGELEENHAREARLKEQTDRETGEEDEEVVIKCRAKLYHFENREWKERGVGDLKVNVRFDLKENSDEEGLQHERKARIIMRTEHVHRVVLNTPIFKGMKVGNQSGDEPNGKFLNLAGMENGKPALFMLKIGKEEVVKELYQRIKELQEDP